MNIEETEKCEFAFIMAQLEFLEEVWIQSKRAAVCGVNPKTSVQKQTKKIKPLEVKKL